MRTGHLEKSLGGDTSRTNIHKFSVSATRAPELSDAEVRKRLAAAYRIILQEGRNAETGQEEPEHELGLDKDT